MACGATFFVVSRAEAVSIDSAALSDQSSASIVQTTGGVAVTANAFGGVGNPQNTMTP